MKHMKIVSGTVLTMALSLALIAVATGTIASIIALQAAESGALVVETQLVLPRQVFISGQRHFLGCQMIPEWGRAM